jgi:hypothetical protein
MHPVIIEFGHLAIRWYGVMIALAFLIGMWLAGKEAERTGIGKERIQDFFLYIIFCRTDFYRALSGRQTDLFRKFFSCPDHWRNWYRAGSYANVLFEEKFWAAVRSKSINT